MNAKRWLAVVWVVVFLVVVLGYEVRIARQCSHCWSRVEATHHGVGLPIGTVGGVDRATRTGDVQRTRLADDFYGPAHVHAWLTFKGGRNSMLMKNTGHLTKRLMLQDVSYFYEASSAFRLFVAARIAAGDLTNERFRTLAAVPRRRDPGYDATGAAARVDRADARALLAAFEEGLDTR